MHTAARLWAKPCNSCFRRTLLHHARCCCCCCRVLHTALPGASPVGSLAADLAREGQQAATATAAEQVSWVGAARLIQQSVAAPHALPQGSRPPVAAPTPYLDEVRTAVSALAASCRGTTQQAAAAAVARPDAGAAAPAAAASPGAAAAAATGAAAAAAQPLAAVQPGAQPPAVEQGAAPPPEQAPASALRRVLRDDREVAAELRASPSDPSVALLRLHALAGPRVRAALAVKLARRRPARLQAVLRQRQQAEQRQRELRRGLLSSQRAALLASSRGGPYPNPITAFQRVLQAGLQLRQQQQQEQQGPASSAQEVPPVRNPAAALRRQLSQGVLAQHKALRKAWREKK